MMVLDCVGQFASGLKRGTAPVGLVTRRGTATADNRRRERSTFLPETCQVAGHTLVKVRKAAPRHCSLRDVALPEPALLVALPEPALLAALPGSRG